MRICLDGRMNADASVVALGMFDGVHVGHQALLKKARAEADRLGVPMVVQTFTRHPLCLLAPAKCPPLLTTLEERIKLVEALGADIFCAQPFTEMVRDQRPEEFVGYLVRQWRPKTVVVGYNYSFGALGAGTPALLRELGRALGFATAVLSPVRARGHVVSATRIRETLEEGRPRKARLMLGRPYAREMTLVMREGGRCVLKSTDNGKLSLPRGAYRAALVTGGKRYPVPAYANGDGKTVCRVPAELTLTDPLSLAYYAELTYGGNGPTQTASAYCRRRQP